jgi:alanyl-tRNA synthetase
MHVDQKGSLVAPDRLRFDFSNPGPVSGEHLGQVESIVRDAIKQDLPVHADLAPLATAKSITGLRAVFGEAYPDPVRIVSIGRPVAEMIAAPDSAEWMSYSAELCGGTHLSRTGEAQDFAVISEEAVAKGVRRVVGLTGVPARAAIQAGESMHARVAAASRLEGETLIAEVADIGRELDAVTMPTSTRDRLRVELGGLQERVKAAQKNAAAAGKQRATSLARSIAESARVNGDELVISTIDVGGDRGALEQAVKTIRDTCPKAAVLLFSTEEGDAPKVSVMAAVPESLVKRGLNAGEWIREAAGILGGKGGGRPDSAQGGGTQVGKVKEAIAAARTFAARKLT